MTWCKDSILEKTEENLTFILQKFDRKEKMGRKFKSREED